MFSTTGTPVPQQASQTYQVFIWLSLKSVRVLRVTHLELRTVVIQGVLVTANCTHVVHNRHTLTTTSLANLPSLYLAELEVSTCLVSHSPSTQNCGNSRRPRHSQLHACFPQQAHPYHNKPRKLTKSLSG